MGIWHGVAMDSLKFHLGLPWPTLLHPVGRPPLKQPYGLFWGGPPTERTACSSLLPFGAPHAVRLWLKKPGVGQLHIFQSNIYSIKIKYNLGRTDWVIFWVMITIISNFLLIFLNSLYQGYTESTQIEMSKIKPCRSLHKQELRNLTTLSTHVKTKSNLYSCKN